MGDAIKITFLTSKNDQHGDNSMHIIPEWSDCAVSPIQLIRLYFWRFGLKFQGTGKTVNFCIGRSAGAVPAVGSCTLSRVNAKRFFQKVLFQHGFVEEAEHYKEKCLKVGSVTNTLAGSGRTLRKRESGGRLEISHYASTVPGAIGPVPQRSGGKDSSGAAA
jgi:hypothetical protein